jgi:putative salt-induced outer membrane protein YdiY
MLLASIYKNALVIAVGVALLIGFARPASAQLDDLSAYTDRIHLRNGDVITGNIKELDRGKLRVKTLTMDTVLVNWVDIESVESNKYLRIEKADGSFSNGTIKKSDMASQLVVEDRGREVEVPILAVSSIQPIRVQQSFLRRLEGDLTAGIDYKKASDILLVNLSTNVRFKEEKYEVAVGANWNETSRTEDNNSSRADLSTTYTRFRKNRWFWKASGGFERNEELGLNLRALVGATAGRYLIQNSTLRFELNAGLAENWEDRVDGTSTSSTEGLIRSSLDIFKHTLPITRLSASINVFPGITESGRMRVNTDVSLRNEIVRSLFWDLSLYHTYDNRPPEGAAEEDYGIVTSIGASF